MAQKNNTVKAVVAIVVICAAGFAMYWFGLRKNPGSTPDWMTFICSECLTEFQIETERVNELRDMETGLAKCPVCETFTAGTGIRCIHCGKHYLERQSLEQFGERGRCPHCKKSAKNFPLREAPSSE
jgi:DNA-directed RNA polymerase subunit RPC12/RpoP